MADKVLIENLERFIRRFSSESNKIKSQVHYQSVINITTQLIKIANDKETEPYIKSGMAYFEKIDKLDYPLGKTESLELYKNYVLFTGRYFIRKKDFRSSWDIVKYLVLGIILDVIAYYLTQPFFSYYIPVFTFFFVLVGRRSQKAKKSNMQYFGIGY